MAGRKKTSFYSLAEIKNLVSSGDYRINDNAYHGAQNGLCWGSDQICSVLKKLRRKNFVKSAQSRIFPGIVIDSYRYEIFGNEEIYLHLYVFDDEQRNKRTLVLNSFKIQVKRT